MRIDSETGQVVPATLGEYRQICAALGGEDCAAVELLDAKIAAQGEQGANAEVLPDDSQMRALLMPLLMEKAGGSMTPGQRAYYRFFFGRTNRLPPEHLKWFNLPQTVRDFWEDVAQKVGA